VRQGCGQIPVRPDSPRQPAGALDADVILAAQALNAMEVGSPIVVATTNVRHLARFVDARPWQDISS
jgi:hypothetical protein